MTFVDNLAFQLFSLAFISGLLFYSGLVGYVTYLRHGPRRTYEHLQAQVVPLGGLGVVVTVIALWGEIVWPLPDSFNILFFDPYLLLGIVLIGFAVSVSQRWRTQYVGLLAAMTGLLAIYYGSYAYHYGMTKEPLLMFLLYVAMGGTAIFTFPVTLWVDRFVMTPMISATTEGSGGASSSAPAVPSAMTAEVRVLFALFLIFLLFAVGSAIMAIIIGGGALPQHLNYAP